jgi:hypothetical protein
VRPVVIAGVERALDEQPAEARAVDEQIGFDAAAVFELYRADEAACVLVDSRDLAFMARHAALFGIAPQIQRIARRIEMIGIVHR